MGLITGKVYKSAGEPWVGVLEIRRANTTISGSDIYTVVTQEETLTDGTFSIEMPRGNYTVTLQGTTNAFYLDIPGDGDYNLGEVLATSLTSDTLGASLAALAAYLLADPDRKAEITPSLNGRGAYDINETYFPFDVVSYLGSSYYWNSSDAGNEDIELSIAGTSTNWQLLAQKGDTGTGVNGDNTAYGEVWANSDLAPTQGTVYSGVQNLVGNLDITTYPLNQSLIYGPTVVVNSRTADELTIPNLASIWDALSPIIPDKSQAIAKVVSPTPNSYDTTVANTLWVKDRITGVVADVAISSTYVGGPVISHANGSGDANYRADVIEDYDSVVVTKESYKGINTIKWSARLEIERTAGVFNAGETCCVKLPMPSGILSNVNTVIVSSSCQPWGASVDSTSAEPKIAVMTQNTSLLYNYGVDDFVLWLRFNTAPGTRFWRTNVSFTAFNVTY